MPFIALEKDVQNATSAAAERDTQLAEEEYRRIQAKIKTEEAIVTTAICSTKEELAVLKRRTRECEHRLASLEVRERSKSDALLVSSKRHNEYTVDYRTHDFDSAAPPAAANNMGPPQARPPAPAEPRTRTAETSGASRSNPPAT